MAASRSVRNVLEFARARLGLWHFLAVLLAALAAAFPSAAADSALFVLENLLHMAPIIALSAALAGAVYASGLDHPIARVFSRRQGLAILAAALIGALTPICGLGVLPLIASLLAAGTPVAPIMAFWLASPVTDPAMIAVTAGLLGIEFAFAKTVIAFAIGLGGGFATLLLVQAGGFHAPLRARVTELAGLGCGSAGRGARPELRFWRTRERRTVFLREARATGLLIGKWLVLAFALESLLRRYLPPELIGDLVGGGTDWAIPLAVLVGTPIYLDGYAALPLVRGLMDLGMTPGAAMAFLIAGGITSVYASVAVFALVRWPLFLWYLALAIVGSLLAGYAYQVVAAGPVG